jgi:hypothetical protein
LIRLVRLPVKSRAREWSIKTRLNLLAGAFGSGRCRLLVVAVRIFKHDDSSETRIQRVSLLSAARRTQYQWLVAELSLRLHSTAREHGSFNKYRHRMDLAKVGGCKACESHVCLPTILSCLRTTNNSGIDGSKWHQGKSSVLCGNVSFFLPSYILNILLPSSQSLRLHTQSPRYASPEPRRLARRC